MREKIDIEALLEWAYRRQCVDRVAKGFSPKGPSASPSGGMAEYMALGTRVDTSSFAARVAGVRLPDDAMIVHDAVLRLGDMWIEWRTDADVVLWTHDTAAARGHVIAFVEGDWLLRPVTPNGRPAAFGVILARAVTVPLVITHAKAGARPDYHPEWKPGRGRPRAAEAYHHARRAALTLETVTHARAIYGVWRAALELLAAQLDGALAGFDVLAPAAPAQPWQERRDSAKSGQDFHDAPKQAIFGEK